MCVDPNSQLGMPVEAKALHPRDSLIAQRGKTFFLLLSRLSQLFHQREIPLNPRLGGEKRNCRGDFSLLKRFSFIARETEVEMRI
jgi:hypothetical protein